MGSFHLPNDPDFRTRGWRDIYRRIPQTRATLGEGTSAVGGNLRG